MVIPFIRNEIKKTHKTKEGIVSVSPYRPCAQVTMMT